MSCSACSYPNNVDYNFCQKCGFRKYPVTSVKFPNLVDVDESRVKKRLEALSLHQSNKSYQRQVCSMQNQLESYLWSLPERKTISSASPGDVIRFLIWKDKFGKTFAHKESCLSVPGGQKNCSCPKTLAAGTIDSNIGKLRSIFKENGRGSMWNDELHLGNPAAHSSVKEYYLAVLEEQTLARTFPIQATPLFLHKLSLLSSHLRNLAISPSLKRSNRYILVRDLAFFSIDSFSGDRGSDLGRVKTCDVLTLPQGKGLLINQVFGKTLRGNGNNVFGLKPIPNSSYCPVSNLRFYVSMAKEMTIDLKSGYLFRATDRSGNISDSPFIHSAVANRLRKHLSDLNILNGETMHSFRSRCSITLSLLGVPYDQVAKLVGWKSIDMAQSYTQFDKVMSTNDVSSLISASAVHDPLLGQPLAQRLGQQFRERNFLNGYKTLLS